MRKTQDQLQDAVSNLSKAQLDFLYNLSTVGHIAYEKDLTDEEAETVMSSLHEMFVMFELAYYATNGAGAKLDKMLPPKQFQKVWDHVTEMANDFTDADLLALFGDESDEDYEDDEDDYDGDDDAPHGHLA